MIDIVECVPCIGGVVINGEFVPFDVEAMHEQAEREEAAGEVYDLDEVMDEMEIFVAALLDARKYG